MLDYMSLARRIVILNREMAKQLDLAMLDYGCSAGNYPYVMGVYYYPGCTQQELSDKLQIDKAATARSVAKLEKEGYLIRQRRDENRREWRLYTTDKAIKLCAEIERLVSMAMAEKFAPLSSEEIRQLENIMAKLITLPITFGR